MTVTISEFISVMMILIAKSGEILVKHIIGIHLKVLTLVSQLEKFTKDSPLTDTMIKKHGKQRPKAPVL